MINCFVFRKGPSSDNSSKDLKLLMIAGVHGEEIGSIQLAYDMIRILKVGMECTNDHITKNKEQAISYTRYSYDIDAKSKFWESLPHLKEITIIPNMNMEGTRQRKRELQNFSADLNRGWDTFNKRGLIEGYIEKSDIIIDMHSSRDDIANCFIFDADMPDLYQITKELKELSSIPYAIRGTTNDTIKRYANSFPHKLGFTWEQMGYNYINSEANEVGLSTMNDLFMHIAEIYWNIRTKENKEKGNIRLSKTIHSATEGIVKMGPSICNESIYEGILIDAGEEICRIESFEGKVLERFYTDDYAYLVQIANNKWANVDDPIAIIQPK